jgi:hypothetical protein
VYPLAPATAYQVTAISSEGLRLGPHQMRTAPRDDDAGPVRLSVGADLDPSRPSWGRRSR